MDLGSSRRKIHDSVLPVSRSESSTGTTSTPPPPAGRSVGLDGEEAIYIAAVVQFRELECRGLADRWCGRLNGERVTIFPCFGFGSLDPAVMSKWVLVTDIPTCNSKARTCSTKCHRNDVHHCGRGRPC